MDRLRETSVTILGNALSLGKAVKRRAKKLKNEAEGLKVKTGGTNQISADDMVLAMSGIDRSSREVASMVRAIKDIADQTRRLALNATIEAARLTDLSNLLEIFKMKV